MEELTEDMKNDIALAFNLLQNENSNLNYLEKIPKIKLRTLLFNFAMYKSAPVEINDFIDQFFPDKEFYSYEDVCELVKNRVAIVKEREIEDIWYLLSGGKSNQVDRSMIIKAFSSSGIDVSESEVMEMIELVGSDHEGESMTKDEFVAFYSS